MTDPIQAAIEKAQTAIDYAIEESAKHGRWFHSDRDMCHAAIRTLAALSRIAGMEWAANYFAVAARGYAEVPMDGFYKELERLRCLPESREEKP